MLEASLIFRKLGVPLGGHPRHRCYRSVYAQADDGIFRRRNIGNLRVLPARA